MVKPSLCPCCGAILLPFTHFPRAKVKQAILDFIRSHPGTDAPTIMDHIYQLDPNGGPSTPSIISVHIHQMRPRLRREGLDILGRNGRGGGYTLIQLNEPH